MNDLVKKDVVINTIDRLYKMCDTESISDYHDLMVAAVLDLPPSDPEHHAWFQIGETLVDESKGHLSAEDAVRKIRELMNGVQKPERKTGKWIACSEEYPEMDERVLVNLDGRYDIYVWDCMSNRDDSYFWEDEDGFFHDKYEVLYWMRIPELSGGDGND